MSSILLVNNNTGIRVQLNATVNLKFNTKAYRNFSTTYRRAEGLLQGSSYTGVNDYILSPIREDILIDKEGTSPIAKLTVEH